MLNTLYMSWIDGVVALGTNGLGLLILIKVLVVLLSICVRNYAETRKMRQVLALIGTWPWNAIVSEVLLLSQEVTTEERLREAALQFSANVIGARGLTRVLSGTHQSVVVVTDRLGDTELMICLSEFDNVLILIWGGSILGQVTPVALSLAESGLFQGLGNSNCSWELV